ncbi:MAG: hypothetical protein PVI43_00590 [Candidatus Bathyarchaeota archaeon]|jgi:hypothetical protein
MFKKMWNKFGFYNHNARFFADDDGSGVGDPGVDGGNVGDGQGGGAGDTGNNNNNDNSNNNDQNQGKTPFMEITVDGETRQLTKEEAIALSQKAAGAEKKFQEAAEMRKQAQNGLRIQELYTRFSDPNHEPTDVEIKEFASFMNISAEELMSKIDGNSVGNANDNKGSNNHQAGNTNFDFDAEFQKRFGKNPAEVAAGLAYTEKQHIENFKLNLRKESDNMVDKDEIFGKIIIDEDEKISQSRQEVIKEEVYDEVLSKIKDGIDKQTALTEAIQKVRSRISRFGISSKPGQYPVTLGLVPGQSLPTEVTSEKPIERVDASDDNAETNFVNRYLQKGISALRSKVKK